MFKECKYAFGITCLHANCKKKYTLQTKKLDKCIKICNSFAQSKFRKTAFRDVLYVFPEAVDKNLA